MTSNSTFAFAMLASSPTTEDRQAMTRMIWGEQWPPTIGALRALAWEVRQLCDREAEKQRDRELEAATAFAPSEEQLSALHDFTNALREQLMQASTMTSSAEMAAGIRAELAVEGWADPFHRGASAS
jgi:hypothetical protein